MILTDIILQPGDACMFSPRSDGTTRLSIPLEVLKRAYCEYVVAEVTSRSANPEGAIVQ